MASTDRSASALFQPGGRARAALLCVLLVACAGEESSKGFPVNAGGAAGGGTGGAGGLAGQGGFSGATADTGGVGGMTSLPTGGAAGMVGGVGGSAGSAGGGVGGMTGGQPAGIGGMGGMAGMGGMGGAGAGGSGGSAPTGDFCARWTAARANLMDGAWNGDTASCDPGSLPDEALEAALGMVNFYRSMAGLDPVEMSAENNRLAQGCALLMAANGSITHTPPASWDCYTQEAADTAASSSVSSGPALESIDGYMIDPGNPTTIGHRRWILSSMLAGIGFGSAGRFSCQYQPAQRPPSGAPAWVAWPPPGQIPIDAFGTFFAKLDQTGWTVQSDSIDLGSADVAVTSGGMALDVTVTTLMRGYGSSYALRFNPSGWTAAAGQTYNVKITGTSTPIEYDVEVIDCP